ncbi:MAG: hypothetical protein CVU87_02690 [Firmicutes bacterium HGW-Firmicutes-12]|nr:MAG: hypothetical protein CVU87_02690 [Firmicutes bacterium HGW-Firmicutes-12]
MELDAKQRVLMAIYTEYQKDLPDMKKSIRADVLGLNHDVFMIAIEKLDNEMLISNVKYSKNGNSTIPLVVWTDRIKMTAYGIQYVEEKLKIEKSLTGKEKVKKIVGSAAEWGWEQIKDIAAKTLAEMNKP